MNLLQVKTSLRAGYAQIQASAQTFRLERLTPLVNETQEFVEDVREGYVQTRNTIHTVGHETLPVWWNTTRRESHAAIQTMQAELTISVRTPLKQRVRNMTTRVRDAFYQVGPLLDEVYEAGEHIVLAHVAPQGGDIRRRQLAELIEDDESYEISPQERRVNREMTVSTACLIVNTMAMLVYPPLMWLSVPGLLFLWINILREAYLELTCQCKVGSMVLMAACMTGMLVLRKFWIVSVFETFIPFSSKAIIKTRDRSRHKLINILGDTPRMVWIDLDGVEMQIPFEDVQAGDRIVIHAGEMIPVDGYVAAGDALIDQHSLTGEAQSVEKTVGDAVYASTMLLSGTMTILVEHAGADTIAAQIGDVLNRTKTYRPSLELWGEKIADNSAAPQLTLGVITLPLLGPTSAVAVMTCFIGYHIRMTAPLSILNVLRIAMQHGILIKDGRALESVSGVDTIVFDKTGTLTHEQPHVGDLHACVGFTETDVLRDAATAEYKQTHPFARAIREEAAVRKLSIPSIRDAAYEIGYGLKVMIEDGIIRVGSARFMQQENIVVPDAIRSVQAQCHRQGHALVYVARDDRLTGAIELHISIRPEVQQVISALKERGLELYILSGDHDIPTRALAQELGIPEYFAEVLPGEKATIIDRLQQQGRSVCFIGDGINDAIALKKASVSVSLRGATTIAMDTAQIVLMDGSLSQFGNVFEAADQLSSMMRRNFLACTIPGVINVSGVYLLGFGILTAGLLSWSGLTLGILNSMLPVIQQKFVREALPEQTSNTVSRVKKNLLDKTAGIQ